MTPFHATRWTLVLRSHGQGVEAEAALSELCETYYEPVVSFLRREGRSDDDAREMAHGFFQQILTGGLGQPDPAKGRFRTYLLGALKNFLSNHRAAAHAAKRGGDVEHVEWDESTSGAAADADTLAFDRDWAFALLERALSRLEAGLAHKPDHFQTLKPWLDGSPDQSQAFAAQTLGLSLTATKVAIHRLRTRFRELIRAEIAATVSTEEEAAIELRHLIAVASRLGS